MIPGMGGMEMLVIAILALVVVGPKDLPMLLRRLGQFTGKVRNMANEFRASFDEMARQSELDELRKEVEALRNQQAQPLGPELENHMREISADLNAMPTVSTMPIAEPEAEPELPFAPAPALETEAAAKPQRVRKKKSDDAPSDASAPASDTPGDPGA
ncbi:MAG TPA: Sec-independent protein translocase protein TatB [Caulobacteraceae bacterium]|jgi:sec-independent protein translocase protein TatB